MNRSCVIGNPLKLTAVVAQYLKPHLNVTSHLNVPVSCHYPPLISAIRRFFTNDSATKNSPPHTQNSELNRVETLVDGCDYEHWLVVMEPPEGYPLRDQIVHHYIRTLAMALGSEEEATKSIYSVSTKYYYAFGCKIPENWTHKIKSLPNVRWVLPDSYLCRRENDYGGEPFIDGEMVAYDEKYHADWLRKLHDDECKKRTRSRKGKRKEKK
ncbi:unnamed protein product [Ilex paraguariensis]|uniref:MORF/ORRM1/DAG-like MORF domain-containing protein n=1 Tax=Ilex paraguariensis TaxID=185542 RepID=A0ABC8UFU5_9AQUA